MESNRQNFLFCPWCTALSFQSGFSPKRNGCGDRVSGIHRLVDTKFHHPLIQGVFHESWLNQQWIVLLLTCFFLWICLVREFLFFQALLQPKSRYIENQLLSVSHQQCTLIFSSYDMTTFVDGTFESSSKSIHGFAWQGKQVFLRFVLKISLKNTNTDHSIHTLKVFCFC